jgi:hypothetical protein
VIVGVAIRWPGYMLTAERPKRHHDVLWVAHNLAKADKQFARVRKKRLSGEQGFVDEHGNWLTREEAAQHALAIGQVEALRFQPEKLFSEDVW